MKKRHQQKLIIIALLLWMGFNMPLVLLFDSVQEIAGFPLIYIYFFSLWVLAILLSLLIVRRYNE